MLSACEGRVDGRVDAYYGLYRNKSIPLPLVRTGSNNNSLCSSLLPSSNA